MNDLEMIKAFAELEDIPLEYRFNKLVRTDYQSWEGLYVEYNPITGLALNCASRDKYKVEIDYEGKEVNIWGGKPEYIAKSTVLFESGPNRAVIECILKSEGLYNEN